MTAMITLADRQRLGHRAVWIAEPAGDLGLGQAGQDLRVVLLPGQDVVVTDVGERDRLGLAGAIDLGGTSVAPDRVTAQPRAWPGSLLAIFTPGWRHPAQRVESGVLFLARQRITPDTSGRCDYWEQAGHSDSSTETTCKYGNSHPGKLLQEGRVVAMRQKSPDRYDGKLPSDRLDQRWFSARHPVSCQQPSRERCPIRTHVRRPTWPPLLYFLLYSLFDLFGFRF